MGKNTIFISSFLFANLIGAGILLIALDPLNFNLAAIKDIGNSAQANEPTSQAFFKSNFESGKIVPHPHNADGWYTQANPSALNIVQSPGGKKGKSLRITINKDDDFSAVANGSPRAELLRPREFYHGETYIIKWKTFLPDFFEIDDDKNEEIITQIHQNAPSGSPPFALGIAGNRYFMVSDTPAGKNKKFFGNVTGDKGKWINWTLEYKPAFSANGLSKLSMNGQPVADFTGPNAYPNRDVGYLKIGIYKWFWNKQSYPSKVNSLTVYFDDVSISQNI